jgi:hypothetical protein
MAKKGKTFHYGKEKLSVGLALEIARSLRKGLISDKTAKKIDESKELVRVSMEVAEKENIDLNGENTALFGI